jgi:hypothetical protein
MQKAGAPRIHPLCPDRYFPIPQPQTVGIAIAFRTPKRIPSGRQTVVAMVLD